MLTTVSLGRSRFDDSAFEKALRAADYERCGLLVAASDTVEAVLASAVLALRERRYLDIIGLLSDFPQEPHERRLSRDVLLGAALALTRDFVAGRRLIDRALIDLQPGTPMYEDAVYYRAVIAWMQHDYHTAQKEVLPQLRSKDANNRARAHVLLSWVALRRGEVLRQVDEVQKALDELDVSEQPDQYYRANALHTLALLCRELPLAEVAERAHGIYESLPWTSGLALERFQITRFLAAINELSGNELAAFAGFKAAARLAPSEHWSVLCLTDRALLARNTGEKAFAAELLQEAHDLAQRLSWNVTGEERSALLILAELFADEDAAIAEQYLARFRSLTGSVIPLLSYGTDPRIKGLELYSQGLAWLRLGDASEGKSALSEAWSIYEDFDYGWRAALCAMHLFDTTRDRRWLQRATRKIAPWPNSWIARRISEMTNASCASLELVPPAKREVLELVRAGRRNSEIAHVLGRSPNTVRNQISQLFQTFNVKSRAELVSMLAKPSTVTPLRPRGAKA